MTLHVWYTITEKAVWAVVEK